MRRYWVSVSNVAGSSPRSSVSAAINTTRPSAASPVQALACSVTSTSVVLTWGVPTDTGGVLARELAYQVL